MQEPTETGYSWVVCAASFVLNILQSGTVFSMGMFYLMFKKEIEGGQNVIALAPSLLFGFYFSVGPLSGALVQHYGERVLTMIGFILATLGFVLTSFATRVEHLLLSYSLLLGIGLGASYVPCMSILAKYFGRRRALATGIAASGSGIGTCIFPVLVHGLQEQYGWRGALLILGAVNLNGVACGALYKKKPQQDGTDKSLHTTSTGQIMQRPQASPVSKFRSYLILFKNLRFILFCVCSSLSMMASTVIFTHLGAYAVSVGYSEEDATLLYLIVGVSDTLARFLAGAVGQIPMVNTLVFSMVTVFLIGCLTMAFPFFITWVALVLYAIFFGVLCAPFNALWLPNVAQMVDIDVLPTAFGITLLTSVPGTVLGGPIAAVLYSDTGSYVASFILAGSVLIGCAMHAGIAVCLERRQKTASPVEIARVEVEIAHVEL